MLEMTVELKMESDCFNAGKYSGRLSGGMNLSYIVTMLAILSSLILCSL